MKQPKYLSLFLAGTIILGGFAPTFVAAEGNTSDSTEVGTGTTETTTPGTTETTDSGTTEPGATEPTTTEPVTTEPVEETPNEPAPVVAEDTTAPEAPVVSTPLNTSTSLTIKGEVGTKATILVSGKTYERVIRTNGEAIFTMSPQPVGRSIEVRLVDASGNVSGATTVVVKEDPASVRPAAPVIKTVDNSARAIVVTGTPGLAVTVKVGGSTFNGSFDANGTYRRVIALQKVGTALSAQAKSKSGVLSTLVKSTVVADTVAPNPARLTQGMTTLSSGIGGTAEPLATVIATIDGKQYSAPVMSTGKFVLPLPKQPLGKKFTLIVRDGAGNRSKVQTITVQHAFFNNFHRVDFGFGKLIAHKEVFDAEGLPRYTEAFAPIFVDSPSKANMGFLANYIAEDGMPLDLEAIRIRVGSATYVHKVDPMLLDFYDNEDGSIEESYFFEPEAKLIAFIKQHVRPENRIVITFEGYDENVQWALSGGEKRAFIQSLQYAGY